MLRQEDFLLPPRDDFSTYVEFVAVYLELRYFARHLLPAYFPELRDIGRVDDIVGQDLDAAGLLAATRPAGAPDMVAAERAGRRSRPLPCPGVPSDRSRPGPGAAAERLLEKAERVAGRAMSCGRRFCAPGLPSNSTAPSAVGRAGGRPGRSGPARRATRRGLRFQSRTTAKSGRGHWCRCWTMRRAASGRPRRACCTTCRRLASTRSAESTRSISGNGPIRWDKNRSSDRCRPNGTCWSSNIWAKPRPGCPPPGSPNDPGGGWRRCWKPPRKPCRRNCGRNFAGRSTRCSIGSAGAAQSARAGGAAKDGR